MASNLDGSNNNNLNKNINNNNNNNSIDDDEKIDKWRKYFEKTKSDIFEIIEYAIIVASIDSPNNFKHKKADIAELLFSCRLATRCGSCRNRDVQIDNDVDTCGGGGGGGGDDDDIGGGEPSSSNVSYGDIEALNDLIEEEKEVIVEVLRIKDVLYNSQDESDSVLFESLRRLQLMHLTFNILQETEIGKAVSHIKRHSSKDIRHLARALILEWKNIVDQWVKSTQELAGGTPDSVNPSTVDEEEGLPSPPMDEGVFFSTQTMDFNQFFDGMDDDGNPRNCGEFNKNRDSGRKPSATKPNAPKRREDPPKDTTPISKDNRVPLMKTQPPLPKPSKPSNSQSGIGRPLYSNGDVGLSNDLKSQPRIENPVIQRRPAPQPEKPKSSNEESVQEKLEAAKRKLHDRYQQAENAKRQRTIQVMEIQDLPKQSLVNRNPNFKFGNHNRHWANGRK
ncbi:hypothetical protein vseg_012402 [Gypsophila vaccaria]